MGIEIIKLNDDPASQSPLQENDLAHASFRQYFSPKAAMSIWLASLGKDKEIFPHWNCLDKETRPDLSSLYDTWRISNSQHILDILFLNQLHQMGGSGFTAVLTGNIKTHGWRELREADRSAFSKGQGCVYHLEAALAKKMEINWVPYYQTQSLIRNPRFDVLWRLFLAKQDEDDNANCLSFFCLKDPRLMPAVVKLLVQPDEEERSEKLADLVDWFGCYSSPLSKDVSTSCVLYTKKQALLPLFKELEEKVASQLSQAQKDFLHAPDPRTALRVVNRHIAL